MIHTRSLRIHLIIIQEMIADVKQDSQGADMHTYKRTLEKARQLKVPLYMDLTLVHPEQGVNAPMKPHGERVGHVCFVEGFVSKVFRGRRGERSGLGCLDVLVSFRSKILDLEKKSKSVKSYLRSYVLRSLPFFCSYSSPSELRAIGAMGDRNAASNSAAKRGIRS